MEECINIKNTLIACSNKYWLKFNVSFGKGLVFVIGIKEEPLICLLFFHVYLKLKDIKCHLRNCLFLPPSNEVSTRVRLTAAYHDLRDPKYHLIKSPFIGLSTIRSVSALQPSILNAVINGLSNILARCSYRLAMAACKSELKTLVEIHLVCHQLFLLCKMLTSLILLFHP